MIALLKELEIVYDNPPPQNVIICSDSLFTVIALKNNKVCNRPDITEYIDSW